MATGRIVILSISVLFLCCAACTTDKGPAKGILVDIASSSMPCGDSPRVLVATAIGGHKARLNQEPVAAIPEVCRRLREVLSYRGEKVVYVNAKAEVPWEDFMELVDNVWPQTDVVSILTPEVEVLARRTYCLHPSCRDCTRLGGFRTRTQ
jgi:hypothetical protein